MAVTDGGLRVFVEFVKFVSSRRCTAWLSSLSCSLITPHAVRQAAPSCHHVFCITIECRSAVLFLVFVTASTRLASDVGSGKRDFNGLWDCLSKTAKAKGPMALYNGFGVSVMGIIP